MDKSNTDQLYEAFGALLDKYKTKYTTTSKALGEDSVDKSFTLQQIKDIIATLPQAGGYIQAEDLITALIK